MSNIFDIGSPAAVFAAIAAGAALKLTAGFVLYRKSKTEYRYVGKVSALYIFPIKSFRGIKVQEAECTKVGLKWNDFIDRHWSVATADGIYLTQRQEPTMALIEPTLLGNKIQLTAPGMEPIMFPANPDATNNNISKITVKTDTVKTIDLGDEVAAWLCRYFKRSGLRLHYSAPALEKRDLTKAKKMWDHPAKAGDVCALSDYCGYMILSRASLNDLNTRLEKPVPITNFRANIVVEGVEAYEEDNWSSVRIGSTNLRALDACTRCILITVDQYKGVKDKKEEPLTTLKSYRLKDPYGEKPCFGINYTMDNPGTIRVGDDIYATLA